MKNRLPPLVIALGFVSLFTDIASGMMVPVLPVFLTVTLGLPPPHESPCWAWIHVACIRQTQPPWEDSALRRLASR
jgi:hypothetical protein